MNYLTCFYHEWFAGIKANENNFVPNIPRPSPQEEPPNRPVPVPARGTSPLISTGKTG